MKVVKLTYGSERCSMEVEGDVKKERCCMEVKNDRRHSKRDAVLKRLQISSKCVVCFLVEHVYKAQAWLMQLLLMLRMGLKNTVDTFFDWYIDFKLCRLTQEHRAERILHLIRGNTTSSSQALILLLCLKL